MADKITNTFDNAAHTDLADKVCSVVGGYDYVGIMDDHNVDLAHRFVASPKIMEAFARCGYDAIYAEALSPDIAMIVSLYQDDIIDESVMRAMFVYKSEDNFGDASALQEVKFSYEEDNFFYERFIYEVMPDIAVQAKRVGIDLRPIDRLEGYATADIFDVYNRMHSENMKFMATKIVNSPDFDTFSDEEKRNFMWSADAEYWSTETARKGFHKVKDYIRESDAQNSDSGAARTWDDMTQEIWDNAIDRATRYAKQSLKKLELEEIGIDVYQNRAEPFLRILENENRAAQVGLTMLLGDELHKKYMGERMAADPDVAQRVLEGTQLIDDRSWYNFWEGKPENEKAVIIYGAPHFFRPEGDIDATIGDRMVTVLPIWDHENYQEQVEKAVEVGDIKPEFVKDGADHVIEFSTGEWRSKTGQVTKIEVPEEFAQEPVNPYSAENIFRNRFSPGPGN